MNTSRHLNPHGENVLVLGTAGSGKTTLAKILAGVLVWDPLLLDMSRVCKVASAFDQDFTSAFAAASSKGELVADNEIMPRLETYMRSCSTKDFFVLSGIFRKPEQVEFCYKQIPYFQHRKPLTVLKINLPLEEAVRRQRERADKALRLGQVARITDLDPVLAKQRDDIYQAEVNAVLTSLEEHHGDFRLVEFDSRSTVHDTFSAAVDVLGMREVMHYAFPSTPPIHS